MSDDFYKYTQEAAARFGLAVSREHILAPVKTIDPKVASYERFGYERFGALWQRRPRPDGLIVFDDVVVRGVITSLLENNVNVPETLKLVLHRNREIDQVCPFRATFLESSIEETAEALVAQLMRSFRGEQMNGVMLPFRVVRMQP